MAVGEIDAAMGAGVGLDGNGLDGMAVGGTAVGGTAVGGTAVGATAAGGTAVEVLGDSATGGVAPQPIAIINFSARMTNLKNMEVDPLINL